MSFSSRPIIKPRRGVSEVMGALLLIVVVIVAVATLASFVAVAEKSAQTRQTYLTSVQNDKLQITFAQFTLNASDSLSLPPNNYCPAGPVSCWASVTMTIRNLNTEPSSLNQIKVAGFWASQWEQVDNIGTNLGFYGPQVTSSPNLGALMPIPARGTVFITLMFPTPTSTDFLGMSAEPLVTQSMSITMLSGLENFFTTVYDPPTTVGQVSVSSVSYQYYDRDVLSLDASQSVGANQSTLTSYQWSITVPPAGSCNTAGLSMSTAAKVPVMGRTTQFFQENFPKLLGSSPAYCLAGPFSVSLSVTDSRGFVGTWGPVTIADDSNMAPIASFSATTSGSCSVSCTVSGTVGSIFGTATASSTTILLAYPGGQKTVVIPAGSSTWGPSPSITCASGNNILVTLGALPAQILGC